MYRMSNKNMNKRELKKLSKAKLIDMLLQQKPFMTPSEVRKPAPSKRKSVSQMINEYEENIILPPLQFRMTISKENQ